MSRTTVKTSLSIPIALHKQGFKKAEQNGQSFSSYVSVLLRRDLVDDQIKPKNLTRLHKQAA